MSNISFFAVFGNFFIGCLRTIASYFRYLIVFQPGFKSFKTKLRKHVHSPKDLIALQIDLIVLCMIWYLKTWRIELRPKTSRTKPSLSKRATKFDRQWVDKAVKFYQNSDQILLFACFVRKFGKFYRSKINSDQIWLLLGLNFTRFWFKSKLIWLLRTRKSKLLPIWWLI